MCINIWPIKIHRFCLLLKNHTNCPCVDSVLKGVEFGCWLMSSIPPNGIKDYKENHRSCKDCQDWLQKTMQQRSSHTTLLNWILNSSLCNECFMLNKKIQQNSGLLWHELEWFISQLVTVIKKKKLNYFASFLIIRKNVQKDLFIWKSDVDNTYQNMPICFQCQFSNIIWVKKKFQEDHFSNFGSSVSPTILCFFFFSFGHLSCELVDFSLESSRLIFSWIIIVGYTFHGEFSLFEDIKYLLTRPSFLTSLIS